MCLCFHTLFVSAPSAGVFLHLHVLQSLTQLIALQLQACPERVRVSSHDLPRPLRIDHITTKRESELTTILHNPKELLLDLLFSVTNQFPIRTISPLPGSPKTQTPRPPAYCNSLVRPLRYPLPSEYHHSSKRVVRQRETFRIVLFFYSTNSLYIDCSPRPTLQIKRLRPASCLLRQHPYIHIR